MISEHSQNVFTMFTRLLSRFSNADLDLGFAFAGWIYDRSCFSWQDPRSILS